MTECSEWGQNHGVLDDGAGTTERPPNRDGLDGAPVLEAKRRLARRRLA